MTHKIYGQNVKRENFKKKKRIIRKAKEKDLNGN
jgi:hypothetical protein